MAPERPVRSEVTAVALPFPQLLVHELDIIGNAVLVQEAGPDRVWSRYGTKFVSAAMDLWAYANTALLDFSRRGKPTDNAPIESFRGRFREECLNVHWFASIDDPQQKIDVFRWDYNEHHPHVLSTAADSPA